MVLLKASKGIVIGAIVLALILGVLVGWFYFSGKEIVVMTPENTGDCSEIESSYIRDGCYISLAVKSSDEQLCLSVADLDQKDLCYTKIAVMEINSSICENVIDKKFSKPKCYGEVTIERDKSVK